MRASGSKTGLSMGLLDSVKKLVGATDPAEALTAENDKQLKMYLERVDKINALEDQYEKMKKEDVIAKTEEFRERLKKGASLDSILVEAFAVVREASWRVLNIRHFDVQLMGGMALHDGRLAEMATGEGKTLVAILPVYLNALTGQSAYVVTTNDYLARRDGETMGQVFRYLGMSVGIIQSYQKEEQRKEAYDTDITYLSNQELGFDFLRDNLAMSLENVVQTRPYNFCVVDEADSILVDEARTPLIISRKGNGPTAKYSSCAQIALNLEVTKHYDVNEKERKIELTPAGFKYCEKIVGKNLYDLVDPWAYYIINAVKAKELYIRDKQYIVAEGPDGGSEISIVDEFTGRVLTGRRFTDGLQQAIEAKENIGVSGETQVVAKVTYQNLFRLFPQLSGMTGTAFTEAAEFLDVYDLKVLPIPTALPVARRDSDDAVFRTINGKTKALLKNVLTTHDRQRPVLIGTDSVEKSEELAAALKDLGINAEVLNARPENVERESEIVSQAGRLGAVTVSTNMAGRGTDILLGGSAKGISKVLAKYMLLVKLGITEMAPVEVEEKSEAVEEVKAVEVEVKPVLEVGSFAEATAMSAPAAAVKQEAAKEEEEEEECDEETDEDVLALPDIKQLADQMNVWLPKKVSRQAELDLKRAVIQCVDSLDSNTAGRLQVEDLISQAADSVTSAASVSSEAKAIETALAVKRLRNAVNKIADEFDAIIEAERMQVKKLGGLYVIGTTRHESRRIDNQLRGRAGRQGDPGSTRFFLSLEDDIFKIFGADKLGGMMDNFRVAEDMPIEAEIVVKALDKVQIQVEDSQKANRQQVFRLDEVASYQRAAIYSQRRAFLTSSDDGMVETFAKYSHQTMEEIYSAALSKSSKEVTVDSTKLVSKTMQFFPNIILTVDEVAQCAPTDELQKLLRVRLDDALAQKKQMVDTLSAWAFVSFIRYLALVQIDESWCKHLTRLDLLKEEMVTRSFTADRDVMETYKESAIELYSGLMDDIRRNTVYSLFIYQPK